MIDLLIVLYHCRRCGRVHQKTSLNNHVKTNPRTRQAGKVSTHVVTIWRLTDQFTAESRRVAPTPMIAVPMVWVVDSGTPKREASKIAVLAAVSAAKPLTGSSRVMPAPIVRMMRQPPSAVPIAMTLPQRRHYPERNLEGGEDSGKK